MAILFVFETKPVMQFDNKWRIYQLCGILKVTYWLVSYFTHNTQKDIQISVFSTIVEPEYGLANSQPVGPVRHEYNTQWLQTVDLYEDILHIFQ